MSHPIPGHEYGENEHPDEAGYSTHAKKTAMAKSMGRHRSKVGKENAKYGPGTTGRFLKHQVAKLKGIRTLLDKARKERNK